MRRRFYFLIMCRAIYVLTFYKTFIVSEDVIGERRGQPRGLLDPLTSCSQGFLTGGKKRLQKFHTIFIFTYFFLLGVRKRSGVRIMCHACVFSSGESQTYDQWEE